MLDFFDKLRNQSFFVRLVSLAGAEGLEPSARGFGGTVEVSKKLIAMPFLSRFCTLARTLKSF